MGAGGSGTAAVATGEWWALGHSAAAAWPSVGAYEWWVVARGRGAGRGRHRVGPQRTCPSGRSTGFLKGGRVGHPATDPLCRAEGQRRRERGGAAPIAREGGGRRPRLAAAAAAAAPAPSDLLKGPWEAPLETPPPHPHARNRGGGEGVGLAHPPIFNTLRCVPRRSTRSAAGSPATVADEAAKRPGHWGISVAYLSEDKRGKNVTGVRLFILPAAVISPNVGMGPGEGASGGRTAFDDQLTVGSLPPPCAMYLGRRGLPASESR